MLVRKQPYLKECVIAHWSRGTAPKSPGVKHNTEAEDLWETMSGRGASLVHRSGTGKVRGEVRRENAGMSSEMEVRILQAEYPRIPG